MPVPEILASLAMRGLQKLQQVTADNLANASSAGFKKTLMAVRADAASGIPFLQGAVDMSPGSLEKTGNPLDLALDGPGFLVVSTPQGQGLVRGGSFTVDSQGRLATHDGALLIGQDGRPIAVGSGPVTVSADGVVSSGGTAVGTIRRVAVDAAHLARQGALLTVADGTAPTPVQTPIKTGYLEQSNVQPVGEMVQMIQTMRSYNLLGQVARADDEMQQRLTTDVGRLQ